MTEIIDVADLDCIYLTYDEPQREEFWAMIKNMVPWARRVDGIKGSDAAHKAAAAASDTDRFILIDGDNLPDPAFFNQTLVLPTEEYEKAVFRWRARNHINGLMYGNGGLSSWTKEFVNNMQTHEHSNGSVETQVEFCFDPLYWPMHDCFSTTYPNGSPFQAWRAGFREGVKMCLNRGQVPKIEEFKETVASRNLNNLTIWQNVGADVENGMWAIYGARHGTFMTLLSDWNAHDVQWFDNYPAIWNEYCEGNDPIKLAEDVGYQLEDKLGLPICTLSQKQSKFLN